MQCFLVDGSNADGLVTDCLINCLRFRPAPSPYAALLGMDETFCMGCTDECTAHACIVCPPHHMCASELALAEKCETFPVNINIAFQLMQAKFVNAPPSWWEQLDHILTHYRVCQHVKNMLPRAKADGPIKLYNPQTRSYEIQALPQKQAAAPAKSTRRKPGDKQCCEKNCTWKVNTRYRKSRQNMLVSGRCPKHRNEHDERQRLKNKKSSSTKSSQPAACTSSISNTAPTSCSSSVAPTAPDSTSTS
jgi:hypothetical protein